MRSLAGGRAPRGLGGESVSRQGPRGGRWSNAGCCGPWEVRDEPQNASSGIRVCVLGLWDTPQAGVSQASFPLRMSQEVTS